MSNSETRSTSWRDTESKMKTFYWKSHNVTPNLLNYIYFTDLGTDHVSLVSYL